GYGNGINITGGDGISILNNMILFNPGNGVKIGNSSAKNVNITNNRFSGNSVSANNTFDDVQVVANTNFFNIVSNHFGEDIIGTMNLFFPGNKARYGINVVAGTSANYTIAGNHFNSSSDYATGLINDGGVGAQWITAPGTAAAPAHSFSNGTSSGFWSPASGN